MRRARSVLASLAVLAVTGGLFSLLPAVPAAAEPGQTLTVAVVRDFDGNGSQGPLDDVPVGAVDVTVTDRDGKTATSATDPVTGVATVDLAALTGPYRVESRIPESVDYLQPAPAGELNEDERAYDPLVAFVDLAGGDSPNLLQAVWNPHQWVQDDPVDLFAVSEYWRQPGDNSALAWVKEEKNGSYPQYTATADQVGEAVWGLAYDRFDDAAYLASYVRRSALWKDSNGTIYRKQDPLIASGAVSIFATLYAGDTKHSLPYDDDADIFPVVGKEGLGDIALNDDGSRLFVVNLFDKTLYTFDTATGAVVDTDLIPAPVETQSRPDDWRPFGLTYHDGALYVGGVDSAETVEGTAAQKRDALAAVVWRFEDGAFDAEPYFAHHGMEYLRGAVYHDPAYRPTEAETHWNAWQSTWTSWEQWGGGDPRWPTGFIRFPQPILSDIAFDRDGSMILAFADRTASMGASRSPAPGIPGKLYQTMSGGDLIRVCSTPAGLEWECENHASPLSNGGEQSPDVREFYPGEFTPRHTEAALGSVMVLPDGLIRATSLHYSLSSLITLDNDGTKLSISSLVAAFGKAGGIGGIAAIADAAIPVQLGNRTWFDLDKDGVQDAGDPDLPGVTVTLYNESDPQVPVATTQTDADGLYYFGVDDGLTAGEGWFVDFDYTTADLTAAGVPAGTTVSDLEWTTPNVGETETQSKAVPVPQSTLGRTAAITLGPGEVNHTLDAGVRIQRVGDFSISKLLSGIAGNQLVAGASFDFTVTTSAGTSTVRLNGTTAPPWTWTSPMLPTGTQVTIAESNRGNALPSGWTWVGNPALSSGALSGESVTITIGDHTTVAVTATNTAARLGGFSVTKQVTGAGASQVRADTVYEFKYSIDGGTEQTATVVAGASFNVSDLTPGASVTLTEVKPADTDAVSWGTPTFKIGDQTSAGSVTFTVGSGTTVDIVAQNPAELKPSTVAIKKVLTGAAVAGVTGATQFAVNVTVGGVARPDSVISVATPLSLGSLAVGTVVTISEPTPTVELPAGYTWNPPTLIGPGGEKPVDGVLTFTVGVNTGVVQAATVTNTLIAPGGFSLTKSVTGSGAGSVSDQEFEIVYELDVEGPVPPEPVTVKLKAGETLSVGELRAGTVVKITEKQPIDSESITWSQPRFVIGDSEPDTSIEFEIGDDAPTVLVELENEATLHTGKISLEKVITGLLPADRLPADASFDFSWKTGQVEHTATVSADTDWKWTSDALPTGTEVVISEVALSRDAADLPAGYVWVGPPTFTVGGGQSVDDTITVTVGDGTTVAITATNAAEPRGRFTLTKLVTGSGEPLVPADTSYTVRYTVDGKAAEAKISAGTTWSSADLKVGSKIFLTEVKPTDGTTYRWGTPAFTVNGTPVGPDGITIRTAGQVLAVTLTNPVEAISGRFAISKQFRGIDPAVIPAGAAIRFTVHDGSAFPSTVELTAAGMWTWTSKAYPIGTKITVHEAAPGADALPEHHAWVGGPEWVGGVPVEGNGRSLTIGDGNTIALTATNTAQALGGFTVTKLLRGSGAALADPDQLYSVTATLSNGGVLEFELVAGETAGFTNVPVGTVVTLTESRPQNSGNLIWGTPQFTIGDGEALPTATFTVASPGDIVEVELVNPVLKTELPSLASTGASAAPLMLIAFGLLVVGVLTRRRLARHRG